MASKKKPAKGKRGRQVAQVQMHGTVPRDLVDPSFLTDGELQRREAFAQAYCACGVGSKAAATAGYTGTSASLSRTASRLMLEPAVKDRIEEIRSELCRELKITTRGVLAEYARIAFFDLGKCFNADGTMKRIPDIDLDTRRALAAYEIETKTFGSGDDIMESVNQKVKSANKDAALAVLSKYLGIIKDDGDTGKLTPEEFMQRMLLARERVMAMRGQINREAALLPAE